MIKTKKFIVSIFNLFLILNGTLLANDGHKITRERISINDNWKFFRYDSLITDNLIYDVRPDMKEFKDDKPADSKPTEAEEVNSEKYVLKPWIMPTGNEFITDPAKRYSRPEGNPGNDFPFVQKNFDDSSWEQIDLPHDWAINKPFYQGWNTIIGGGMGRLPVQGVAWYRKIIEIPENDRGKSIFLDIDGAMSYAMVWINGNLAGGWPFGYTSFRIDLTPYIKPGEKNQLAIRLDNPPASSRWYPGAGIYRNVWLVKTNPVHVSQWGTYITCKDVSKTSATIDMMINIDNESDKNAEIEILTEIFETTIDGEISGNPVSKFENLKTVVQPGKRNHIQSQVTIQNPQLWGPYPIQTPHLYVAVTTIAQNKKMVDKYNTRFGIRTIAFDPEKGILVNGEHIIIKGANQHHDLGALGAAFNRSAAKRQLDILREAGCNAIRMSHNPPAPELLELTDKMGFLVINEIFDVWERKKTPYDFHLIFPDWHEQDMRAFIRRDRNCPSVITWSVGNEVGEQYTGEAGSKVAQRLCEIVKEEDGTRPTTTAMNFAKPDMPLPSTVDLISLNYQGEGIRNAPAYAGLKGINTPPLYPAFHEKFPDKVIVSSENAAAFSTRGEYIFPVVNEISAPIKENQGGDPNTLFVSSYELYTADFGSSADKVFRSLDQHPYVAGGFVWSGWDYIGEPTPYYLARSSYFGIIDLAGFKKDRFYLYQSYWRPDFPMVHILPHWNWPDRSGKITPVHIFTSGDEAELFLNGKSLGKKKKEKYQYRLRWDDVIYEAGELKAVAYKNGNVWAEETIKTTEAASKILMETKEEPMIANGKDLAFVIVKVVDLNDHMVPHAKNNIQFSIEGPGEIVATDNGNPADFTPFNSFTRNAFNGYCLVIIKGVRNMPGEIKLVAKSDKLHGNTILLKSKSE